MPRRRRISALQICIAELLESRTLFAASLQVVASFDGTTTGDRPTTMVEDLAGNLYGTTFEGGPDTFGTIWELTAGQTNQLVVLANFTNGAEGGNPNTLVIDPSGNLFGTTLGGGANGKGTIFELPHGSGTIVPFIALDTTTSNARLKFSDAVGNVFGVDNNAVFQIPAGTSNLTTVASTSFPNDVAMDANGNIFGSSRANGSLFEIAAGSNIATTFASFSGTNGATPNGVIVDAQGNLYGSTQDGGGSGNGTLFKVAAGTTTILTLASFNGTNGTQPANTPTVDSHGDLFGLTDQGGDTGSGTFYVLPAGSDTPLVIQSLDSTQSISTPSEVFPLTPVLFDPQFDPDSSNPFDDDDRFNFIPYPEVNPIVELSDGGSGGFSPGEGLGNISHFGHRTPPPPPAPTPEPPGTPVPFPLSIYAATVSANPPDSVVGGAKANTPVKIKITDSSDQPIKSTATAALFVSPDGELDDAIPISGGATTAKLSLKPTKSKSVSLTIKSFPNVPAGAYQILASITDTANNTTHAAGPSLTISPPFVVTTVSNLKSPVAVKRGKKTTYSFTLANSGNITAAGRPMLTTALSTLSDGSDAQTITSSALKVNLKPGAHSTFKVNLKLPANFPPGSFFLSINLAVSALGDATASDGNAISAAVLSVT